MNEIKRFQQYFGYKTFKLFPLNFVGLHDPLPTYTKKN